MNSKADLEFFPDPEQAGARAKRRPKRLRAGRKVDLTDADLSVYAIDLGVPTGRGLYVQRESEYPSGNAATVVNLSKRAWKIFDPYWKTQTSGNTTANGIEQGRASSENRALPRCEGMAQVS